MCIASLFILLFFELIYLQATKQNTIINIYRGRRGATVPARALNGRFHVECVIAARKLNRFYIFILYVNCALLYRNPIILILSAAKNAHSCVMVLVKIIKNTFFCIILKPMRFDCHTSGSHF